MANLKSKIFSPVIGEGNVALFHVSGSNFLVDEAGIKQVKGNLDRTFSSLVEAMYAFEINESGIKAYYDLKNNRFVKHAHEDSLINSSNFFKLNEMKSFLNEKRKQAKLNMNQAAVHEVEVEINKVEEFLKESTSMPMVVGFTFDSSNKKTYLNSSEILDENIADHIFATGQVIYEHKGLLNLFETACKNFDAYQNLDFISEITEGDLTYSVMRKNSNAYVYRYNRATNIASLNNMAIVEAIDYILENTGQDVSYLFEDILESAKNDKRKRDEMVSGLHEMIAFLKDKRGDLANYNKNMEEIKKADSLINEEIKRLESEIKILEADDLSRNDGYVPGTLEMKVEDVQSGTEVMVDAVAYAAAGKDDPITFFFNDRPYKIEKRFIELAPGETI
jgi:hypothetical protein